MTAPTIRRATVTPTSDLRSFALATGLLLASCASASVAGLLPTADGRLYAERHGSGPDLVLLHGLGDSSVTWRKLAPRLSAAGYRVTTFDALGAGRSDKPSGPYDIPAHVGRLEAVLDRLAIDRTVLVANSLGGSIALRFAELHTERVRALVLISPAAYAEGGWTGDWLWQVPELPALLEALPARAIAELALAMNFGDPARITADDLATYTAEAERPGAFAAFVEQQRQVQPSDAEVADWLAGYDELSLPVLVLWGSRDRILDPALGPRLCHDLPRATLVTLPGVGHAAQLEAPDAVLAAVLPFLQRLPRENR